MSKTLARSYSGAKLIEKRVAAGLTVHQLAAKARVSVQSLQKWERGAAKPQAAKARAVRDVLAQMQPDIINRDALTADVKACREALQDLDAALRTLDSRLHIATGYFCKLAAHVDAYAQQVWDEHGEDFLATEAARNGSK